MKLTIRLILIWMAVLLMGCSGDSAKNGAQQGNLSLIGAYYNAVSVTPPAEGKVAFINIKQ